MSENTSQDTKRQLHHAAQLLAGVCDGAVKQDGVGFNGVDTHWGHRLAGISPQEWSDDWAYDAWEMLRKYRVQLSGYGVDYDDIPAPVPPAKRVSLADGRFTVEFKYDADLVAEMRRLPGRQWDGEAKVNHAPLTYEASLFLADFLDNHKEEGFTGNKAAHEAIQAARSGEQGFSDWLAVTRPAAVVKEEEPKPEPKPAEPAERLIDVHQRGFIITFPFHWDIVNALRDVPGRSYRGKVNTVPATGDAVKALRAFAEEHEFTITEAAQERMDGAEQAAVVNLEQSSAADSDFDVEGLGGTLRPFQRAGVEFMTRNHKAFVADQMGLGKTVETLAALKHNRAFPAVVVCPASLKLNWAREARKWIPGVRVEVLSGRNGKALSEADIFIINYDILKHWVPKLRAKGIKAVAADEAHYVKNSKAQRSRAVADLVAGHERDGRKRAKGQYKVEYVWFLTGTPVLNRPSELAYPLTILGTLWTVFGGWQAFMNRYCDPQHNGWGWSYDGATNLEELNTKLRVAGAYIRRTKDQVLKELPPKQRGVIPVSITNRAAYQKTLADTSAWFADRAVEEQEFISSIQRLNKDQRAKAIHKRRSEAHWRASQAEQLTRITALKQVAAQGKVKAVKEWVADFLDSGEKLVLFAWHRSIVKALADEFNAPVIDGSTSMEGRDRAVQSFQEDDDTRLIVCNIRAGGVGLTLTGASNVAFIEQGWTPAEHDQAEDRVHRIGQESDSVNAWYFIGEDTIDDDIYELISEKRTVVDAATEGVAGAGSGSILPELVSRLSGVEVTTATEDTDVGAWLMEGHEAILAEMGRYAQDASQGAG